MKDIWWCKEAAVSMEIRRSLPAHSSTGRKQPDAVLRLCLYVPLAERWERAIL